MKFQNSFGEVRDESCMTTLIACLFILQDSRANSIVCEDVASMQFQEASKEVEGTSG